MPSGRSSTTVADDIFAGLQNLSGAIMGKIVKNKGVLTLPDGKDDEDKKVTAIQEILNSVHDQMLSCDSEKKGLFKSTPCKDAFALWDKDEQCKFSRAAKLDSEAWAQKVTEEIRPWMKKQYMKRHSQRTRDEKKTHSTANPLHAPTKTHKKPEAPTNAAAVEEQVKKRRTTKQSPPTPSKRIKEKTPDVPTPHQDASSVIGQASSKMQLVQRLSGMDEGILNALLNAATQSQTVTAGTATMSAPTAASLPGDTGAQVEEEDWEYSMSDGEEAEEDKTATVGKKRLGAKKVHPMKAMKAMKALKVGPMKVVKAKDRPKADLPKGVGKTHAIITDHAGGWKVYCVLKGSGDTYKEWLPPGSTEALRTFKAAEKAGFKG